MHHAFRGRGKNASLRGGKSKVAGKRKIAFSRRGGAREREPTSAFLRGTRGRLQGEGLKRFPSSRHGCFNKRTQCVTKGERAPGVRRFKGRLRASGVSTRQERRHFVEGGAVWPTDRTVKARKEQTLGGGKMLPIAYSRKLDHGGSHKSWYGEFR